MFGRVYNKQHARLPIKYSNKRFEGQQHTYIDQAGTVATGKIKNRPTKCSFFLAGDWLPAHMFERSN